jgi:hypothetical protein
MLARAAHGQCSRHSAPGWIAFGGNQPHCTASVTQRGRDAARHIRDSRCKRPSNPETKVSEPVVGGEPIAARRTEEGGGEQKRPSAHDAVIGGRTAHMFAEEADGRANRMAKAPQTRQMPVLELDDVLVLLRQEVEQAGGQVAWSQRTGVDRVSLNRVLNGYRPPSARMIEALYLRVVFTPLGGGGPARTPTTPRSLKRLMTKSKPRRRPGWALMA